MRAVDERLVTGVRVDRRHEAVDDAEVVVEHLHQRHETVGGTRCVRNDLVLLRVERLVVDPVDERLVGTAARRRDDHERCAAIEVEPGLVPVVEHTGRLDHDVDTELAPRNVGRVALAQHLECVGADLDAGFRGADLVRQRAHHRVVLQQVRHRVERPEVVHRDEVDVGATLLRCSEEVAADTTESVDANSHRHSRVPFGVVPLASTPCRPCPDLSPTDLSCTATARYVSDRRINRRRRDATCEQRPHVPRIVATVPRRSPPTGADHPYNRSRW